MGSQIAFQLIRTLLTPLMGKAAFQNVWEGLHSLSLVGMNFGASYATDSGESYALKYIKEKSQIADPITIFDVGANIGNYTSLVLRAFKYENVKVFSFEPSRTAFERLKTNVGANRNVVLKNFGFGESNKKMPFFSNEDASGLSSLYDRRLEHIGICMRKTEDVEIQKLDDFCSQNKILRIHLLKIDVEGNEYNVLRGGEQVLNDGKIDFVQFEFGGCNIDSRTYFQDFYYLLRPKYRIYRILQNGLRPIQEYDEKKTEIFTAANYLAEKVR